MYVIYTHTHTHSEWVYSKWSVVLVNSSNGEADLPVLGEGQVPASGALRVW